MEDKKLSIVAQVNNELNVEFTDPAVVRALTATTFKGFKDVNVVKQACLEAMINGYTFQDILKKKIYAIPFGNGYSLVQSIGDVRAIAMKSGQIGKDAPIFEEDKNGNVISCSVTIKKLTQGFIGDYTAKVFFKEYNKGRDNWVTKPRTMIAKVAEMHALRMAFPEQLEKAYIEEEFDKDTLPIARKQEADEKSSSLKMGNLLKPKNEKYDEANKDTSETESAESYQEPIEE
ncbi:MAG: recombinase RecT [bacterium]